MTGEGATIATTVFGALAVSGDDAPLGGGGVVSLEVLAAAFLADLVLGIGVFVLHVNGSLLLRVIAREDFQKNVVSNIGFQYNYTINLLKSQK